MKKKRFSEDQIIKILSEFSGGKQEKRLPESRGLRFEPSPLEKESLAKWIPMRPEDKKALSRNILALKDFWPIRHSTSKF